MHHRKIVVIGINQVTLMTRWQVQKLLGDATPIMCFSTIAECPPLTANIPVLLLTSKKPPVDQLKRLGQRAVYHAPLKPTDADTLTLYVLEEITSSHPSKGRQVQLHWRDVSKEPPQEDDLAEAA